MPIDKNIQAQVSFWNLSYLSTGQTRSIPNPLLYSYSSLASYPGSATIYRKEDKGNTKEEDVKGTYILLSGILAVVTSAVNGTTISPAVDVIDVVCIRKPILLCDYIPTLHLYKPERGTTPFFMDDLCHT